MLRHHIKTSIRGLFRNKFSSSINVLGLSIGMGVCLAIFQYIHFEFSYDKFHVKAQNTYRLTLTKIKDGEESLQARTSYALGAAGKEEIPGIEQFVRIHPQYFGAVITNPEQHKVFQEEEEDVLFVDSVFLEVFNFSLRQGDPEKVLDDKYSIVITAEMAEKYFGPGIDPIGKILKVDGWAAKDFIVTGVLNALPANSHLKFNFLIPMASLMETGEYDKSGWGRTNFFTYITVNENASIESIEKKLDQVAISHFGKSLAAYNEKWKINLQPITEVHLKSSGLSYDFVPISGNLQEVKAFSTIAVFILIIAWVNFINLSTSRSMERAKGVGVRKAMGAFQKQLMHQFLVESLLINFIAAILSIIIAFGVLSILINITGKELTFIIFGSTKFWIGFVIVIAVGSIVSGFYPAFVLSSFKSANTQRIKVTKQIPRVTLRKSLVVFQFLISALLISGTYLVYKQITFMKNEDLGVDMEQILVVRGPSIVPDFESLLSKLTVFKSECLSNASVLNTAGSGTIPSKGHMALTGIRKIGDLAKDNQQGGTTYVDFDFFETYKFKFLSGRAFDSQVISDRKGVVINEEAVKVFELGSPENAIQQQLIIGKDTVTVVGVLKNYNWNSLKDAYAPSLFLPGERARRYFSFTINLSNIPQSLDHIRVAYNEAFPGNPFDYFFLDDEFNSQYQADLKFGKLFATLCSIAMSIASLGLFALVYFSTTLRIKEIGIRKILGARLRNLIVLLSKEYLLLLVIANLLAIPIIIFGARYWLANYAFRIDIGLDLFIVPAIVLLIISILTVGHRIYITAKANPVDSLRAE